MKNTWLLNFPTISQECDLCLIYILMIYLEFLSSYEEKENVIPFEANFHSALEFSFKHFREHFPIPRY